jgi:transcription elongation factor GreA
MAKERIPVTREGYLRLEEELRRLKTVERPKIIKEIAEARAHGDLSENAEYVAAKEKQSFIEGRIMELEAKLAMCEIIELKEEVDRVVFGAYVLLKDLDDGQVVRYRIVGEDEANPREGLISIRSPLARALVGKRVGEEVEVRTPGGEKVYEVISISSKP